MLASKAVPPIYKRLLSSPALHKPSSPADPLAPFLSSPPQETPYPSLDWLIHTGGSLIISKIEQTLSLSSKDHTTASWEIYKNKGNTSSVSIGAVIEKSREIQQREGCVAVSFGPGVTVEMVLLRRTGWKGRVAEGEQNGLKHGHENGVNGNVEKKEIDLKVNGNGVNGLTEKAIELYI